MPSLHFITATGSLLRARRAALLLAVLFGTAGTVQAQSVEAVFTFSDGREARVLRAGLDPQATSGLDAALGEAELPPFPPSGVFEARFMGDSLDLSLGEGTYYDYRSGSAESVREEVHEVRLQRGAGTAVVVSWDIPEGAAARIEDAIDGTRFSRTIAGIGSLILPQTGTDRLKLTLVYGVPSRPLALDIPITVANGTSIRTLRVGLDPSASSAIDRGLGEAELPPMPPSGVFDARLVGDNIDVPLGQGSLRDYRNGTLDFTGDVAYEIRFQRGDAEQVTLSWALPEGIQGRLEDVASSGAVNVPVSGEGSFTVTNTALDRLKLTLVFAAPETDKAEVEYSVVVSDGRSARALFFGLDPGATDGLDAALGEEELPPMPPSGAFEARLMGTPGSSAFGEGSYRDFRPGDAAFQGEAVHELRFQSGTGNGIIVAWALPDGVAARLEDVDGGTAFSRTVRGAGSVELSTALSRLRMTVLYGAGSGAEVSIPLILGNGSASRTLRVGMDPAATPGFDDALGEAELPPLPPSDVFDVRLVGDQVNAPLGQGAYLDYRQGGAASDAVVAHQIRLQPGSGGAVTLAWELPSIVTAARLRDVTGSLLDQQISGSGSVQITNSAIRDLVLTLTYNRGNVGQIIIEVPAEGGRAAQPLPVTITIDGGFVPTTGTLFYRRGGENSYQSLSFDPAASATPSIPAEFVTERGVEFYVVLTNSEQQSVTFPSENPEANPSRVRVTVPGSSLTTTARQYQMVTVPIVLDEPAVTDVLDELSDYNPRRWRFLRWLSESDATGAYNEFPDHGSDFTPGNAYWLITADDGSLDVGSGLSVPTDQPFRLALRPGWNQIGNPFAFPVAWSDAVGEQSGIDGPRRHTAAGYDPPASVLEPWQGYFVFNDTGADVELSIPAREPAPVGKVAAPSFLAGVEYALRIGATASRLGLRDAANYVGFAVGALEGKDGLDFYEAPNVGTHLRLSILGAASRYDGSFMPSDAQGRHWEIEVGTVIETSAIPVREPLEIELEEIGARPTGFETVLVDRETGARLPVIDGRVRVDATSGRTRGLLLILGTSHYAEQVLRGGTGATRPAKLEGSFPNPLRQQAEIRYHLPHRAQVELEIFDVLGRRVRRLRSAQEETGTRTATWDGASDSGQPVPSGVYLCRLTADDASSSIRLIVVR